MLEYIFPIVVIGLAILIVYLIVRTIYRWIKRMILLWRSGCKKAAIIHLIKGLIVFGIIFLIGYFIKEIAVVAIAVIMGAVWLRSRPIHVYID